jgi:hypothetical protein
MPDDVAGLAARARIFGFGYDANSQLTDFTRNDTLAGARDTIFTQTFDAS